MITNYSKLTEAEKQLAELKEGIKTTIELIDKIEEPITLTSELDILGARIVYDNLTDEQKGYITNYDKLVEVEKKLSELKQEKADKKYDEFCAKMVIDLIDKISKPVT